MSGGFRTGRQWAVSRVRFYVIISIRKDVIHIFDTKFIVMDENINDSSVCTRWRTCTGTSARSTRQFMRARKLMLRWSRSTMPRWVFAIQRRFSKIVFVQMYRHYLFLSSSFFHFFFPILFIQQQQYWTGRGDSVVICNYLPIPISW